MLIVREGIFSLVDIATVLRIIHTNNYWEVRCIADSDNSTALE